MSWPHSFQVALISSCLTGFPGNFPLGSFPRIFVLLHSAVQRVTLWGTNCKMKSNNYNINNIDNDHNNNDNDDKVGTWCSPT